VVAICCCCYCSPIMLYFFSLATIFDLLLTHILFFGPIVVACLFTSPQCCSTIIAPPQQKAAQLESNKRKWQEGEQKVNKYHESLPSTSVEPLQYQDWPEDPLLRFTKRRRFDWSDKKQAVSVMHREITDQLYGFITRNHQDSTISAVYIHGPQGMGKSHSLFEVVGLLRRDPKNRVIYIPDCGAWADLPLVAPYETFITALQTAFPSGPVSDFCRELSTSMSTMDVAQIPTLNRTLLSYLQQLPQLCKEQSLQLYAVFDQHNGMSAETRRQFPFSLVESILPDFWHSALVVISASANNSYHLKVASDNKWPEFTMNHGFTDDEFLSWINANSFFPGDPALEYVKQRTACIPYELRLLLDARMGLSTDTDLLRVMEYYESKRTTQLGAQQRVFYEEFIKGDPTVVQNATRAVVWMELGLSTSCKAFPLNQQLMYQELERIYPITPLAREILIDFWQATFTPDLKVVTEMVFRAPLSQFTADTKGRVLEKYIIHQLEQLKYIDLNMAKIDASITDLSQWQTKRLKIHNLITSIHFLGPTTPPKPLELNWKLPILFVPDLCNYPDIDFFLWDPATATLLAVQITVLKPLSKHPNKFFELHGSRGVPADLWKLYSKDVIKNTEFLWIAADTSVCTTFNRQYLVTLDQLPEEAFPLVKHLNLL
jgi:hypothetical protein